MSRRQSAQQGMGMPSQMESMARMAMQQMGAQQNQYHPGGIPDEYSAVEQPKYTGRPHLGGISTQFDPDPDDSMGDAQDKYDMLARKIAKGIMGWTSGSAARLGEQGGTTAKHPIGSIAGAMNRMGRMGQMPMAPNNMFMIVQAIKHLLKGVRKATR